MTERGARRVVEGRRFTRRTAEVHATEHGEAWLYAPDPDEAMTAATLARLRAEATAALDLAALATLRADGPSAALDHVLHRADLAPDSRAGLAARLLVALERVEVLPAAGATPRVMLAEGYRLGRLVALWRVYGTDDVQRAAAAKAPRPAKADPLRAALVAALRRHRRAGRTLAEALDALSDATHGVRVRPTTGASFRVTDESAPGSRARVLSRRTLDTLWAEAAPPRRRAAPATSGR